MDHVIKAVKKLPANDFDLSCFDFVSIGLSCHALCLLEHVGILKSLLKSTNGIHKKEFAKFKNPHLLSAAFSTLVNSKVLRLKKNTYTLTRLGENLAENIGVIMLPFMGYRNLLVKQYELIDNPKLSNESDIDFPVVAESSIGFGMNEIDPILEEIFTAILRPGNTICDLGCGSAEKIAKVCKETNCYGLGIERDSNVVSEAQKHFNKNKKLEILQGDILKLHGVWEDVEIAMINFVFHDFSEKDGLHFLSNIKVHFPRLRYLIVTDIVSLSESYPSILPGFDYVHGLQNITPRNYEESIELFKSSKVKIAKELKVPNMPNTFVWLLQLD